MRLPHPIPYQGSKRTQASLICTVVPSGTKTFYEPFAGSAAVTLAAASKKLAGHFVIGDSLVPLVDLWEQIVLNPSLVADRYEELWRGQREDNPDYYFEVRSCFNQTQEPAALLYLIARCVKNAVRFGRDGRFTQSHDRRRLGMAPDKLRLEVSLASSILRGRVSFYRGDFRECVENASSRDFVYMDPPYEGTSKGPDRRYFQQLERSDLEFFLVSLRDRLVPFALSYDGRTGEKVYGEPLSSHLYDSVLSVEVGKSSQLTLNGVSATTVESLYVSRCRGERPGEVYVDLSKNGKARTLSLFPDQ